MAEEFAGFCIVEIMGHKRLAGHVRAVELAGSPFFRVDLKTPDGREMTQFYSPQSIYCLTPTSDEMVRQLVGMNQEEPVNRYELTSPGRDRAECLILDDDEYDGEED